MGIGLSGLNKRKGADVRNVPVDGGSSVCTDDRRLTRSASTNTASNISNTTKPRPKAKQPDGYDVGRVSELIATRKLAPFYEGVEEQTKEVEGPIAETECDAGTSGDGKEIETVVNNSNSNNNVQAGAAVIAAVVSTKKARGGCFAIRLFKKKKQQSSNAPIDSLPSNTQASTVDSKWLTTNLVECPICCLSYPLNTNWTACCSQPMCTFCFLHLRFPPSGREITCPFCNGTGFGVKYYEPEVLAENDLTEKMLREEAEGSDALSGKGHLVKSDTVRIKPSLIPPRPRHHSRQYSHNRLGPYTASSSDYYHRRQSSYINAAYEPWYFTPINMDGDNGYMSTRRYGASPWFAFP